MLTLRENAKTDSVVLNTEWESGKSFTILLS